MLHDVLVTFFIARAIGILYEKATIVALTTGNTDFELAIAIALVVLGRGSAATLLQESHEGHGIEVGLR